MTRSALDGDHQGRLANLPRRIYLTYKHRGIWSVIYRALVFPLRLTPLDRILPLGPSAHRHLRVARRWYDHHGRPVTVVIPSFQDAKLVAQLVTKIYQTVPRDRVRIVVTDDAGGSDQVAALRRIEGIELLTSQRNGGFAVNVNRGLRAADPSSDVVLLNSDVVPLPGWLACLQQAASSDPTIGIVGAKLLYPDNRIQYAGTIRNPKAPEWFDHRYRFKPRNWGPADLPGPTLAATGACMYIRHEVLEQVGLFDEEYGMGYEDVDYCLRTWEAGFQVMYAPAAQLHHHESLTRGTEVGERERRSQRVFWNRWASFFDERRVVGDNGRLRVVYVTEHTFAGGGHRVVFEHLNGLIERGYDAQLWTLDEEPEWFDLRCPVRRFADYDALVAALAPVEAIKVATWWKTATPVWRASVVKGIPVYLVQDIETSYYRDDPERRYAVLASYRPEFHFVTTSTWNQSQLRQLGLEAAIVSPGVDVDTFRPLPDTARRTDLLVSLGRSDPLKNLPLTIKAWRRLPRPRPELCLFGREPSVAHDHGIRYVSQPTDDRINTLLNQATVFVQTSRHEGFCLPILEAMAAGAAVVCTDAHGNLDFCRDGENCLLADSQPSAVAAAIARLLANPGLRTRIAQAGMATASGYTWRDRIDELERVLFAIAEPRRIEPSTDAVPAPRRR